MVGRFLDWAVHSKLVVLLLAAALAIGGGYAFYHVNVEAYPDPAPAIIEIVAIYPGASAEEVERQVTVPLEIALAGMPGLKYTRSKSLYGLAYLRNQFEYGVEYLSARQEVLNRLAAAEVPASVKPEISPASPIGEIYRYVLTSPRDELGNPYYTLNDLKSLQDWTLERELRRIPGVAGVVACGGTVKRYEVRPDPDRLKEYGITLAQLESALAESNANVGGDLVRQGGTIQIVRGIGLIGGGEDPLVQAMHLNSPAEAAAHIRAEELRRIREIRQIVVTTVNNTPIRVGHLVQGGPVRAENDLGQQGVVVSFSPRQGRIGLTRPILDSNGEEQHDASGQRIMVDDDDVIQAVVLLRKGEKSLPTLHAVEEKINELNATPGRLLPGVQISPYYDRSALIDVTTETVHENLLVGLGLVTAILLMFLGNVRCAVIVAINIPLALLFAFGVLFFRGRSANLLSIGAVDFGIIVDSTVIMVENIYRRLSTSQSSDVPLDERVLSAAKEVERSLFFSTLIMVCALLPLFTMQGPEGQIFGPMADTYACALGGALLLALTVSPVLCVLFLRKLKPARENILVRSLQRIVGAHLRWCLDHRGIAIALLLFLFTSTVAVLPYLGREFMPELEEGNLVVRGTFPVNVSIEEVARTAALVRRTIAQFPEVRVVASQIGRPDDGMDPTGFHELQCFVPLKDPRTWPVPPGCRRRRSKSELVRELDRAVESATLGVEFDFSQIIRDNVMESLSGVKGENSIKIFGPDLPELERLAAQVTRELQQVQGLQDVGVFRIMGQTNLSIPVDRDLCALWGVNVSDVEDVIQTAVGGAAFTQMVEGERRFDIVLRWPEELRQSADGILRIPVDVVKNVVTTGNRDMPGGPFALGTALDAPSISGSAMSLLPNAGDRAPQRRLGDLVLPTDDLGRPSPDGSFLKLGAANIGREQSQRCIAVRFSVRGRDLASAVEEARARVEPLIQNPYVTTWSGEFQQMQEAEQRMLIVVSVSLLLILVMLYLAFFSLRDALLIYANVLAMFLGGLWALLIVGLNFNISAAVGFISILGVAVMNGLLMVSSFNRLRADGVPLREALLQGTDKLVRPIAMTALAAILGLLPAALSTKIGSQSQRPLAIVVVGGMIMTLALFNLMPVLYSFYGHRTPKHVGGHAH